MSVFAKLCRNKETKANVKEASKNTSKGRLSQKKRYNFLVTIFMC